MVIRNSWFGGVEKRFLLMLANHCFESKRFEQKLKLVCSHLVSSTFDNPTIVLSIPETVPVNVGESNGAFESKALGADETVCCIASINISKPTIVFINSRNSSCKSW
jgi:hypothetical protein